MRRFQGSVVQRYRALIEAKEANSKIEKIQQKYFSLSLKSSNSNSSSSISSSSVGSQNLRSSSQSRSASPIQTKAELLAILNSKRNEIEKYLQSKDCNDIVVVQQLIEKNILLFGTHSSGKSTIVRVLKDLVSIAAPVNIFIQNTEPKFNTFNIDAPPTKEGDLPVHYCINIIESTPLFEFNSNDSLSSSSLGLKEKDHVLNQSIFTCLDFGLLDVHLICYVLSVKLGIDSNDINLLSEWLDLFEGAEKNLCLIVTRAENLTDGRKEEIVTELMSHPKLKILNERKIKVMFSGSITREDREGGLVENVKIACENVYGMRKMIYEHLFSRDPFPISSLSYFKKMNEELKARMKAMELDLSKGKDYRRANFKVRFRDLEQLKGFVCSMDEEVRYLKILKTIKKLGLET